MARRRDLRRFGRGPYVLGLRPVLHGALHPALAATKPRNGYFLRAESFFNVAAFVDSGGEYPPDLSYDDLDAVRFTRSFLDAPDRFLRAALGE